MTPRGPRRRVTPSPRSWACGASKWRAVNPPARGPRRGRFSAWRRSGPGGSSAGSTCRPRWNSWARTASGATPSSLGSRHPRRRFASATGSSRRHWPRWSPSGTAPSSSSGGRRRERSRSGREPVVPLRIGCESAWRASTAPAGRSSAASRTTTPSGSVSSPSSRPVRSSPTAWSAARRPSCCRGRAGARRAAALRRGAVGGAVSYILDALRKAERERQAARVPTLHTTHESAEAVRPRPWPWAVAGAFALSAVVLYVVWGPGRPGPVPEVSVTAKNSKGEAAPPPPPGSRPPGVGLDRRLRAVGTAGRTLVGALRACSRSGARRTHGASAYRSRARCAARGRRARCATGEGSACRAGGDRRAESAGPDWRGGLAGKAGDRSLGSRPAARDAAASRSRRERDP